MCEYNQCSLNYQNRNRHFFISHQLYTRISAFTCLAQQKNGESEKEGENERVGKIYRLSEKKIKINFTLYFTVLHGK